MTLNGSLILSSQIKPAVLYTTILDLGISTVDIVTKYSTRWDIEISIREMVVS